jgi:hypothetical protein
MHMASSSRLALLLALFPMSASAVSLACAISQTDGVSLKTGQNIVRVTTDSVLKQGTLIDVTTQLASGGPVTNTITTHREMRKNDTILGGDTPRNARGCTAKVSLAQSTIDPKKKSPSLAK